MPYDWAIHMPRKTRIDACLCVSARRQAAGALHHIICRGVERSEIFVDDIDSDNSVREEREKICRKPSEK